MKTHKLQKGSRLALGLVLVALPTLAAFAHTPDTSLVSGVTSTAGSLDYVICMPATGSLNVRDETLTNVLFVAKAGESVKLVQSFGTDKMTKVIDGRTVTFTKVQFASRPTGQNIGWTSDTYTKLRSECSHVTPAVSPTPEPAVALAPPTTWMFPTSLRPSVSYRSGMRRFGASRSGGRLHAACDLYRVTGEKAAAVTSGTVIRGRYYFYQGTYAIEVKHAGGRVVRYGEITGQAAPGVATGRTVSRGQTIGYIGKVNSGCCTPMLHFEMYTGTRTGSLSASGGAYERRSDLMNPTTYLAAWEKAKFGSSW